MLLIAKGEYMTLLTIEKMKKVFGAQTLFENLNLGISEGEKIGLIGLNGTGKSTLLKIISGSETLDEGKITRSRGLRVSHLLQDPEFDLEKNVLEQVQYFLEQKKIDVPEFEIKTMLNHLEIEATEVSISKLSGGQKKRVALCAVLLTPCDLLILDEPTNHMDNETIDWLEQYLKKMKCAILMVTHDRYFLNRIVNKIFELSDQCLYAYEGRYETYLERKSTRLVQQASTAKKMKNLYVRELAWIRAGVQARSTKSKSRIQRFEALQSEMKDIDQEEMIIESAFTRLGKKILEIEQLTFGYDKPLCSPFSYMAVLNDRIGIIGKNGVGKSTLLNTLAGQLEAFSGVFEFGSTVKVGYFTQNPELDTDPSQKAIDYIREIAPYVENKDGYRLSAGELMEQFLFDSALQYTPVGSLSGGERRRLQLLKILVESPNVLLLDEPTNNLDLDTLKALEGYLDSFEGVVFCVSHDRYFLDRTCDKLFVLNQGELEIHAGNYSDYLDRRILNEPIDEVREITQEKEKIQKPKSLKKKLSYNEIQQLEQLPKQISTLEQKLADLEIQMQKNASDYAKIQTLFVEKEEIEMAYLEALEAYEALLELKAQFE